MLRAGWVMVLTHYLLLLFLLALQAQNVQSAPVPGQRAAEARESVLSAPEREPDSTLIPSWYLKRKASDKFSEEFPGRFPEGFPEAFLEGIPEVPDELLPAVDEAPSEETDSETVSGTFPMEEPISLPVYDEETEQIQDTNTLAEPEQYSGSAPGQKGKTDGRGDPSKYYILGIITAAALLLLGALAGCLVVYVLLKRRMRTQEDKEAPRQVSTDSSWPCHDQSRDTGETESEEGPGTGKRAQANSFGDSCHLFPEVFAAELAQLYKNMAADPSPLPTCPSCALADGTSSRDHWISLDSPQPTPSFCFCYQYQQKHFILEDNDCFSASM
ncbi:uncharacterized protein LOC130265416 [Oenanthe melanoleuca]|uniref:uncharacterized protein LOC130265416 n=1 Tax=Oenanthe melanoleuca TaxID=2939378 RepID=UPI0024C10559|nr:uncharacterized protein LOC130265416 [Oenanthe melanoleuca]